MGKGLSRIFPPPRRAEPRTATIQPPNSQPMKSIVFAATILTTCQATVCDIFASANTPCVAAHSVTRRLFKAYDGPIYIIKRSKDNATLDIKTLPSGVADASAQDQFCQQTQCTIDMIYDQSPQQNNLALQAEPAARRTQERMRRKHRRR